MTEPVDIFLTHVPANLRAKFGRARCRELLADPAAVQSAWSRLVSERWPPAGERDEEEEENLQPGQRRRPPQRLPPLHQTTQQQLQQQQPTDWYKVLSEQFNSDYSPGVAATRQAGHNQETHSVVANQPDAVRLNDGPSSRYKLRKDEFAAYNEIIYAERKFNSQWASGREGDNSGGGGTGGSRRRQQQGTRAAAQPPPQQQQQPQQRQLTSILSSSGASGAAAGNKSAAASGKRVTIVSDDSTAGQQQLQQQSLHRANTIQRSEDGSTK